MNSSKTSLLELVSVTRLYEGQDGGRVEALKDVSLTIAAGEFICITGPSGSGKTTLMHIVGCLDRPTSGSYRILGRDVHQLHSDALALLRRSSFGFVFHHYNLLDASTAQGNVELPGRYAGMNRARRRRRSGELLSRLGLSDRIEHLPSDMSGGEQQRVAIARALMNGGRVILADEPTGALDRTTGERILETLAALAREGHTVVLITHNQEIARRAPRCVELRDGRIVRDVRQRAELPITEELPAPSQGHGRRMAADALKEGVVSGLAVLRESFGRKRRLRTVLSLVSVALSIWWIVTLMPVLEGLTQIQLAQISTMGANNITLIPSQPTVPEDGDAVIGLSLEDMEAIEALPNIRATLPRLAGRMTVQRDAFNMQATVIAYAPGHPGQWGPGSLTLAAGSPITQMDDDRRASVALIGSGVRATFFPPPDDPVGQFVTIDDLPFRIKGVTGSDGRTSSASEAGGLLAAVARNSIHVPYSTGAELLFGSEKLRMVDIWVDDPDRLAETAQSIRDLLIRRHGSAGFTMFHQAASLAEWRAERRVLMAFVLVIGGIALLAGALGIMAVMLMSVTGRTREIGIRMAIGARRRDVLQQFLIESTIIVVAGAALGIVASGICGLILALFEVPLALSGWVVPTALGSAIGTGLLFGLLPARRAARLDPTVALAES